MVGTKLDYYIYQQKLFEIEIQRCGQILCACTHVGPTFSCRVTYVFMFLQYVFDNQLFHKFCSSKIIIVFHNLTIQIIIQGKN